MVESEAKEVLAKLFTGFPQLRAWLKATDSANATYDVWIRILEGCGADDAMQVVESLIVGDLVIEAYDREKTAQIIRREANKIRSSINEKRRMKKLSFDAHDRTLIKKVLGSGIGGPAIMLGELKKYHGVSQEDHDTMLEELFAYDKGAERPDWLDGLEARLRNARNEYYGSVR